MMYKKEKNSRCLENTEEFFCIQQISNLFVEHEHTNIENKKNVLEMGIEELDLEVRSYNCLKRADIHTIGDLICKTEKELIKVKYMQKRCLEEIQCQLAKLGLALRSSDG